jgi:hypothetical protein
MISHVADVSEEGIASIIRATEIGELATLFLRSVIQFLDTVDVVLSSPILVTMMM